MSLSDILMGIIGELEGSRGVAVVGMDGILVEEQKRDGELDLQTLGAEFSGLLRSSEKAFESVEAGEVVEIMMKAARSLLLLRRVTPEYFVMLVLHPDGNLGKGRFLLRRAGVDLKPEL